MNELDQPDQPEASDAPEAQESAGLVKVEGRDPATVRAKRAMEAEVERKVASDYSHIVLAYGVIWTLFAIYGVMLWRRASAQKADIDALRAKLDAP